MRPRMALPAVVKTTTTTTTPTTTKPRPGVSAQRATPHPPWYGAPTRIWVDADATPRPVKEMLYRVADGRRIEVVLVANQLLRIPPSRYVRAVVVGRDFDAADEWVAAQVQPGDLVITADVPLAAQVVE